MTEYVVVDKNQLEADLTIVADSIRAKGGTTEKLDFPLGMKSAVESIQTGITKPEQEKTIEITENGTTEVTPDEGKVLSKVTVNTNVESGGGSGESDVLTLNINALTDLFRDVATLEYKNYVFYTFPRSETFNMSRAFAGTDVESVKIFGTVSRTANMANLFYSDLGNKIRVFDVSESMFTNISNPGFYNCSSLEEVRFPRESIVANLQLNQSPMLSAESIQNIIDSLKDLTGSTSSTIRLHYDVKDKLTEAQISAITSKNWTLA